MGAPAAPDRAAMELRRRKSRELLASGAITEGQYKKLQSIDLLDTGVITEGEYAKLAEQAAAFAEMDEGAAATTGASQRSVGECFRNARRLGPWLLVL